MSIRPLEGDIAVAADATLARMNRKINELVGASNDDFKAVLKLKNNIVDLQKELREIKIRLMNQG
jgi:hypothetical protein